MPANFRKNLDRVNHSFAVAKDDEVAATKGEDFQQSAEFRAIAGLHNTAYWAASLSNIALVINDDDSPARMGEIVMTHKMG